MQPAHTPMHAQVCACSWHVFAERPCLKKCWHLRHSPHQVHDTPRAASQIAPAQAIGCAQAAFASQITPVQGIDCAQAAFAGQATPVQGIRCV
eukprot:365343-Chlamydomonas_euryale.AAC.2